MQANIQA